jgi:hypothetical protein
MRKLLIKKILEILWLCLRGSVLPRPAMSAFDDGTPPNCLLRNLSSERPETWVTVRTGHRARYHRKRSDGDRGIAGQVQRPPGLGLTLCFDIQAL